MNRYLEEGTKLNISGKEGTFEIHKIVGRGASCVVYHAEYEDVHGNRTEHLLKEYNPKHLELYREASGELRLGSEADCVDFENGLVRFEQGYKKQLQVRREIAKLKNVTGNVQDIYYANGTRYIDMTCNEGMTYDKVKENNLLALLRRMKALTQTIGHYHNAGMLHLDIKPQNIYAIPETCEMVLLFDFDSVVNKEDIPNSKMISYTKNWAAPEQLLCKRGVICEATDIFAIGEILFYQIFGRHSEAEERRRFAVYEFEHALEIFKNVNPKVFELLPEIFHKTICGVVSCRYQSADELVEVLDKAIKLADPKEPYLKTSLPTVQSFFVGRDTEIEEIHQRLSQNNVLFVSGVGGIGKSELVKHYAVKYRSEYDAVIFAPYVSSIKMMICDDFAVPICNFSQFPEESLDEYFERKLQMLRNLCDKKILLIIDNYDFDDRYLSKIMRLEAKILITTRRVHDGMGCEQISISHLAKKEDVILIFSNFCKKELTEKELVVLDKILKYVDNHTMLVELLAKHMYASKISVVEVLTKLERTGFTDIGEEPIFISKDGVYKAQYLYEFIHELYNIVDMNDDEKNVLFNLSLIPPTGIKLSEFCGLCNFANNKCINELEEKGWIKVLNENISMHVLIAESMGNELKNNPIICHEMLANLKNQSSNELLSLMQANDRKQRVDLIEGVAVRLVKYDISSAEIATFLTVVSQEFYAYGKVDSAIYCRKRALKIQVNLFGEKHENTATAYYHLGKSFKDAGRYEDAEQNYYSALKIRESIFKKEHEKIASIYDALSVLKKEQEVYDEAEEYAKKALQIREKIGNDKKIAVSHNNLGNIYRAMGDYATAKFHHTKSLQLRKYLYGEYHEKTAIAYDNIGVMYRELGDLETAEKNEKKALDIRKKQYGEMNILTATTYANLGTVYKKLGIFGSARVCYQNAMEIRKRLLGPTHPNTVKVINKLMKLPDGPCREEGLREAAKTIIQAVLKRECADLGKSDAFSCERCPDQIVAKIKILLDQNGLYRVSFLEFCDTKNTKKQMLYSRTSVSMKADSEKCGRIILILESPHRDEFNMQDETKTVFGPAYGKSGDNINAYFHDILEKALNNGVLINKVHEEYELILVNAIQYQCSLGQKTSLYRDKLFWECWKNKCVREDFEMRVKNVFIEEGDILINCCTIGNNRISNHDLINIALENMSLEFYEGNHPSSWGRNVRYRNIKKHIVQ